jgi:hypothetical protein
LGCFDWSPEALANFGGVGTVDLTFDHDGLFLKGDLVMRTLASGLVTVFLDLTEWCVWSMGVACLGPAVDAFEEVA